jgi:diphthamide synthase subunit DPH2
VNVYKKLAAAPGVNFGHIDSEKYVIIPELSQFDQNL